MLQVRVKLSSTCRLQADVFEPDVVRSAIKGLLHSAQAKDKFEKEWKADVCVSHFDCDAEWLLIFILVIQVDKRVKAWTSHKDNKRTPLFQLQWESEVVQYVDYINAKLSVHWNSGPLAKDAIRTLDKGIPLLGPIFPLHLFCTACAAKLRQIYACRTPTFQKSLLYIRFSILRHLRGAQIVNHLILDGMVGMELALEPFIGFERMNELLGISYAARTARKIKHLGVTASQHLIICYGKNGSTGGSQVSYHCL